MQGVSGKRNQQTVVRLYIDAETPLIVAKYAVLRSMIDYKGMRQMPARFGIHHFAGHDNLCTRGWTHPEQHCKQQAA